MLFYKMVNICARLRDDTNNNVPPAPSLIITETDIIIETETGIDLIEE